jgi:IS1 family transposase
VPWKVGINHGRCDGQYGKTPGVVKVRQPVCAGDAEKRLGDANPGEESFSLTCKRLQVDEIWAFVYAKAKNAPSAKAALAGAGDIWTWMAIDADTKLIPSSYVGRRDSAAAFEFIGDLALRLSNRVQLSSDGHKPYLEAVEHWFGADIDYAMLIKIYGDAGVPAGRYSPAPCMGAKYVESANLTLRMGSRRFTRLTSGFSKKAENHAHTVSVHMMHYNFVRIHQTLRCTPAMAAGVSQTLWELADMVRVLEDWEAEQ